MQSALSKVAGVTKADVKMPNSASVTVDKSKNVTAEKLIAAVKAAGYSASVPPAKK
ncbi:MAG: hypothetical protein FJ386_12685 [Verrucomicrobia bacterium]|nr:hypothetical protein [Verrucomicrobiota bacterium]